MVSTHNSVHMVEEVFVCGEIVGVISPDHVLDHIRDERNLSKMMKMTTKMMLVMSITLKIMKGKPTLTKTVFFLYIGGHDDGDDDDYHRLAKSI